MEGSVTQVTTEAPTEESKRHHTHRHHRKKTEGKKHRHHRKRRTPSQNAGETAARPSTESTAPDETAAQTSENAPETPAATVTETPSESPSAPEQSAMPIAEFKRKGSDLIQDMVQRVKQPVDKFWAENTEHRQQKRNAPFLLAEITPVHQELQDRMRELQDIEVQGSPEEKKLVLNGVSVMMQQNNELIGKVQLRAGIMKLGEAHYLVALRTKYSTSHPLYTLVQKYKTLPGRQRREAAEEEEEDSEAMEIAGLMMGLLDGSKDSAQEGAKLSGNTKVAANAKAANEKLGGLTSMFGVIANGYALIQEIIKLSKMKKDNSTKAERDEQIVQLTNQLISSVKSVVDAGDSLGLYSLEKQMPIIGVVIGALNALLQGGVTIAEMVRAGSAHSAMADAKRGLEDRLFRNAQKENKLYDPNAPTQQNPQNAQATQQAVPQLHTKTKREGFLWHKEYKGVSAQTVGEQKAQFRSGFTGNIYLEKLRLKQQRDVELQKKPEERNGALVEELDEKIGRLRIAQDLQRLGVTDEAKSKQTKKLRSGAIDLVMIAVDLGAAIAKLFPGIGDMISAGLSLGKATIEASSKFGKWIYQQTKWYREKQQKKEARRSDLADTIMERLDMLSSNDCDLATLLDPGSSPDRNVVKAVYKEYEALTLDLQKGMGVDLRILATAKSKTALKNRLVSAFSQEG